MEGSYDEENPPLVTVDGMAPHRPWGQASVLLGVPLIISDSASDVTPGFGFEGRFGWDLGMLVPEVMLGHQTHWFNNDRRDNGTLSNTWLSLGLRLQIETNAMILPFVSGAVDFNFWDISGDDRYVCDDYYCDVDGNVQFAPGFSGKAGIQFRVHPIVSPELGVRVAMTFPGNLFDEIEGWLTPYLGVTFRF